MATAYIINQESRVVVVIPDVEKIEGNTVCGKNASASGIDLNQTKIIVIETPLDIKRGDIFPDEYEDISDQFRKISKDDQIDEMNTTIGTLLLENSNDKAMITSLEDTLGTLLFEIAELKGGAI
ncbi:hypothetical protein [Paenibacillus glucanolyticus]|uniref:hypothetical protein n=1 Tax=Paenibacillus glucanolyticus TaxID=59843 RepID=UPI00096F64D6|nr:hypothetical protein [Paenibacillus glucanolyticus]OMF77511.1 hypothetical protein BK142_12400 [Paenibacillus glucanolyticus]